MTNRGTARRMSITWIEKDGEEKPKVLPHRERHPNDILSFAGWEKENEDYAGLLSDIEEDKPNALYKPKKKSLKLKREKRMLTHLENDNREKLAWCSRSDLQLLGMKWLGMFRRKNEIESPDMPIDNEGERIEYPAGRGRGKVGIAEWLCRYYSYYRTIQAEADAAREIEQSLL